MSRSAGAVRPSPSDLLVATACGGQLAPSYLTGAMKIGFVPKTLDQEFWVTTEQGARAGGRREDATVLVQAPTGELAVDEQIAIVENLLTQNIDALVIAPSDSILMKPVLTRASEEVPVILVDTDIPGWKEKDTYIGSDNFAAGSRGGTLPQEADERQRNHWSYNGHPRLGPRRPAGGRHAEGA